MEGLRKGESGNCAGGNKLFVWGVGVGVLRLFVSVTRLQVTRGSVAVICTWMCIVIVNIKFHNSLP